MLFGLKKRGEDTNDDGKEGGHPVEVVVVGVEVEDLGDDGSTSPLRTKELDDALDGGGGSLTDGEDGVSEPAHAEVAELVIKELASELLGKKRDVLDDGETHAPLAIEGELDDGRQEGLGEELDADELVDVVELGDDVETDLRKVVLEEDEEDVEEVLEGVFAAEDGSQSHDHGGERGAHLLRRVSGEVLDAGDDVRDNERIVWEQLAKIGHVLGGNRADLRFRVAQKGRKGAHNLRQENLRTKSLGDLWEKNEK